MESGLLQPAVALIAWTLVVWILMYATRLPAIAKARVNFAQVKNGAQLRQVLPERINWIADNYNHLHEQPVLFYSLCVILTVVGGGVANIKLAWAYVGIRVAHSLWQSFFNQVHFRFVLFVAGTLVTYNAVAILF